MLRSIMGFKGTPPPVGKLIAVHYRSAYDLYFIPGNPDPRYINLKLISSPGKRRPKSNYRLAYDRQENRLVKGTDASLLLEHVPAMHAWVLDHCKLIPSTPDLDRSILALREGAHLPLSHIAARTKTSIGKVSSTLKRLGSATDLRTLSQRKRNA